jgi:hypothetical protein
MNRNHLVSLACALFVFVIGAGIHAAPVEVQAPAAPASAVVATVMANVGADGVYARNTPIMPTVTVIANPSDYATASVDASSSVMLDGAVEKAGQVIAGRVGESLSRIRIGVPFYAFGGKSTRHSD